MSLSNSWSHRKQFLSKNLRELLTLTILLSMLMMFSISTAGCSIGIKERVTYASVAKFPEESKGTIIIATNRKIAITVGGTDIAGYRDLGGYAAINLRDLKFFVEAVKENQELKKQIKELKKEVDDE